MLRRPPTTLTLTPTDLAAYEVSRANRLAQAAAAAKKRQKQKLKQEQRQEQRSPSANSQEKNSRARITDAPLRRGDSRQNVRERVSAQGAAHTQRQAQAHRIFGREAGSVGPAIDEEDEYGDMQDDDDLGATLPTPRVSNMRGGDPRAALFRGNASMQPDLSNAPSNVVLPSDTESNTATDTDTEDDEDVAMETEGPNPRHDRWDDDDPGASRGASNNLTIQGRMGISDSRYTHARNQPSTSNTRNASGTNRNNRTRQATPQIQGSDGQSNDTNSSTVAPDATSHQLPASRATSSSIPTRSSQPGASAGRGPENAATDLRNKRQGAARVPRRQWV